MLSQEDYKIITTVAKKLVVQEKKELRKQNDLYKSVIERRGLGDLLKGKKEREMQDMQK